jgi:hypothetical protein
VADLRHWLGAGTAATLSATRIQTSLAPQSSRNLLDVWDRRRSRKLARQGLVGGQRSKFWARGRLLRDLLAMARLARLLADLNRLRKKCSYLGQQKSNKSNRRQ